MATIDWVVGGLVAILGLFILYRALKEPMDLAFGFIGAGIRNGIEWLVNAGQGTTGKQVISYG